MPLAAIATLRLVAIAFACLIIISGASAQETISQYQVKAAYLFNFLKFVEYPEDSFSDPLAPVLIGVVGDNLFGVALSQVVIGKTVQGRDIVIRNYRDTEDLRGATFYSSALWSEKNCRRFCRVCMDQPSSRWRIWRGSWKREGWFNF